VLDLAKIERGALQVDLAPAPIGPTVAGVVASFRESEEGRRAGAVGVVDESGGASASIDPDALSRIVVNFLTNAVKYSPEKSPISVRTSASKEKKEARIEVVDRGRGMSREESARLFVPFYRARPEDAAAAGVGLGLVISHELARLMSGRIEIDSEPGKGSTFTLVLPLA
jgi:signal transduction histidine kinase